MHRTHCTRWSLASAVLEICSGSIVGQIFLNSPSPHCGLGLSNTMLLGPRRVFTPNRILILQPFLHSEAEFGRVTDRLTDRHRDHL